jgi:hypothetical protein
MRELDIAGRGLELREEGLGLERRLKGLQIGELERQEKLRLAEEARMQEPSNIRDIKRILEFSGPAPKGTKDPVSHWAKIWAPSVPAHLILREDPKDPDRITGFDLKKWQISDIWADTRARYAREHPDDFIGRSEDLAKHIRWAIDHGARIGGKRKKDAQLGQLMTEFEEIGDFIEAQSKQEAEMDKLRFQRGTKLEVEAAKAEKGKDTAQQLRAQLAKLYGWSQWEKLDESSAARLAGASVRARTYLDAGMNLDAAAKRAFNEDPKNIETQIKAMYPEAYMGDDGQWYLDKDDKTFRIRPIQ